MNRTYRVARLCVFSVALLVSTSVARAQTVTVTNAAGLINAINQANTGAVTNIVIDASGSGGVINLTGSLPQLGLSNTSYTITAAAGTTVQLTGNSTYQLFSTLPTSTGTVTFDNVSFANGTSTTYGGAIYSATAGTTQIVFQGTTSFTNNSVGLLGPTSSFGGAIYNASTQTFSGTGNVTFSNNQVSNGIPTYISSYGGAIYNTGTQTFSNQGDVTFSGNSTGNSTGPATSSAGGTGGAIYNIGTQTFSNQGSITFSGNSAVPGTNSAGGAIVNGGAMTFSNAGNITFSGNLVTTSNSGSGGDGGAIWNAGAMTFSNAGNVTFSGNSAVFSMPGVAGSGGAILNSGGYFLTFSNQGDVIFSNNTGGQFGGAITDAGAMTFSNTGDVAFSNNKASWEGGAIYNSYGTMTFSNAGNVVFFGNTTAMDGGAIENSYSSMQTFSNTGNVTFSGNSVTNSGGLGGGAIFNNGTQTFSNAGNVIFDGNSANFSSIGSGSGGGAICNWSKQTFSNGGDVTFSGNTAGGNGGAIYNYYYGTITFSNTGNVSFVNNAAGGLGGAYYGEGNSVLTIAPQGSVLFQGNTAGGAPNAIYLSGTSTVNLTPALGAQILFYDPIASDNTTSAAPININANGPGTVAFYGSNNSNYYGNTTITDGRFMLMSPLTYGGINSSSSNTFSVDNATLGLYVNGTGGAHSVIQAGNFTTTNSANMFLTNVSTLPQSQSFRITDVVVTNNPVVIGTGMQVHNSLMSVSMVPNLGTANNADLAFDYLNNISTVVGPKMAVLDVMRLSPNLTPELRNAFDIVYHTGVVPQDLMNLFSDATGQSLLSAYSAWQQQASIFHQIMRNQMGDLGTNSTTWLADDDSPRLDTKKHLWGVMTQLWSDQGDEASSPGYRYRPMFATIGCDEKVNDWTLGIAGQYSHGTVESGSTSFTNTDIDALSLGLYGGRFGEIFYGKGVAQAGMGWNDVHSYYASTGEADSAAYKSAVLGSGLEFGARLWFGGKETPWELTPHMGADYYYLTSAAFEEHGGSLAHGLSSCDQNVVEIPIGLRLSKAIAVDSGFLGLSFLKPSLDVAYVRSAADNVPVVAMHEMSMPDVVWNAYSNHMGRDIFRTIVGITGQLGPKFTLGADYWLETRDNFTSQQVNLNATYAW